MALIAKITAVTVLLSGIFAFTENLSGKGSSIVLADSQSSHLKQTYYFKATRPANLIGVSGGNDQLETGEILESPSVLKPIFDFVKQHKQQKGTTQDWRYTDWLENLTIELVKGTSVLELATETQIKIWCPRNSKNFCGLPKYSVDRERGIKQAIQYLDQQIDIYRREVSTSAPPRNMASNKT